MAKREPLEHWSKIMKRRKSAYVEPVRSIRGINTGKSIFVVNIRGKVFKLNKKGLTPVSYTVKDILDRHPKAELTFN